MFLFTNGTLLNEKNSEMILNSSVSRLFISIDAATEKHIIRLEFLQVKDC